MTCINNKYLKNCLFLLTLLYEIVLSNESRFLPHLLHTNDGILDVNHINHNNNNNDNNIKSRRMLSGNTLSSIDKQALLDAHNKYRMITARGGTPNQPSATNMNELFWDPALAKVAENYTRSCVFAHNSDRLTQFKSRSNDSIFILGSAPTVGENLYLTTRLETLDTLLKGLEAFYAEYQYFTYDTLGCTTGQQCGHYKQMVQGITRYVGCGYTYCDVAYYPDANKYYYNSMYLACNYSPASSSSPYISGNSCSGCGLDRTCMNKTICSGCPNPNYYYCSDSTSSCPNFANYCPTDPKCFFNSTSALCSLCRNTCKTCYNEGINVTKSISTCNNGISTYINNWLNNINNNINNGNNIEDIQPTLSPTINPTKKPTLLPTQGINLNYCCHANEPDRYEERCNLLTSMNTCNDILYNRRCYWLPNDKCITPIVNSASQYYCNSAGTRKKAACQLIDNQAECEYNACTWEVLSS